MSRQEVVDHAAWAVHAWYCPPCFAKGFDAMATSSQDHVTIEDRIFAHFLVVTLGLVPEGAP